MQEEIRASFDDLLTPGPLVILTRRHCSVGSPVHYPVYCQYFVRFH
jgi:hypothetical protein